MLRAFGLIALLLLATLPARAQTPAATINGSATITTGNTFQTVLAALGLPSAMRRSLTIENNNASDSCWIYIGGGSATKATAILLLAGGAYTRYYPYVPSDAIQATCASSSDTLYLDTQ